ncbi:MAG: alanine--tRNA ligase [Mariniblastus sp.]|nr:alanine--tRNA ligase [Mariniblastus sp.]
MKTDEIREKYLEFFQTKDHRLCPSDVLVPKWDKSVLFTPAGMNQFKDHFLGKVELDFSRATSCQKCLRTGDIENVGRTAYHHTFFEMLGNFSFGDYFKQEAIFWAWEFLTDSRWLGIDKERLTVTVYQDDDEAAGIWRDGVGLAPDRITRLGEQDNFWPAGAPTDGPDGVCGPCSEIFFHPDEGPECEIWNLVFTQFNRGGDPPDNLQPLPRKNIDTGMGLERMAATLQGVTTNYHIDTLMPIVEAAAEIIGVRYVSDSDDGRRLRRITDHVRACTMAIHENVYPGSNKEEYVIRRLLRRAVLQGHEMGLRDPFLFKLVPEVVNQMKNPYPDLVETMGRVGQVIEKEEASFLATLDDGLARIERIFESMKSSQATRVDGQSAADLYQTFGIPAELFESIAAGRGFSFDWNGYQSAMQEHGRVSGKIADTVMGDFGPVDEIKKRVKSTEFLGYQTTLANSVVCGLVDGEEGVDSLAPRDTSSQQIVVLEETPFYAESGGQVGDGGIIQGPDGEFEVVDTRRNGDLILHFGSMRSGQIKLGDPVEGQVDSGRREAIQRAHSATHLLHYALQQTLGEHAQQRGSKVTDDWLRFDFSNMNPVTPEELVEIEQLTNQKVDDAVAVRAETLPLESAKQQGAMMLFGEKYPDPVRMVSIGEFSKELCGGTHLNNSSEIKAFEIVAEESVSSGTRRIEALSGQKALEHQQRVTRDLQQLAELLEVSMVDVPDAIEFLGRHVKDLKKQVAAGKRTSAIKDPFAGTGQQDSSDYFAIRKVLRRAARQLNVANLEVLGRVRSLISEAQTLQLQLDELENTEQIDAQSLLDQAETVGNTRIVVQQLPNSNPNLMRQLIDQMRKKDESVAAFLATAPAAGKVVLVAGVSKELVDRGISAGDWVKQVAPIVGGGGGGKPDLAQAGGKQPEKLAEALAEAGKYIQAKLES